MTKLRLAIGAAAALVLAACGDDPLGFFPPGGPPASVQVILDQTEIEEGGSATASLEVRDEWGDPLTHIPHWAQPVWSIPGGLDVAVQDGHVTSTGPGMAQVTASIGTLHGSATLRVNATSVTLRVDGIHLNQGVQRYNGTVPLIAGRPGMLRVFVTAIEPNRITPPPARIELYMDGDLVHSATVSAEVSDIPIAPAEASLEHSWNLPISAELAQPGLAVRVEVDPDNTIPRRDAGGPVLFPLNGEPLPLAINPIPDLKLRFVPIHQSLLGTTGDIGEHNVQAYMSDLIAAFPIAGLDYDYRDTYVTSAIAEGGTTNWVGILFELDAVRAAEAHDNRYYYGVLTRHQTGTAGIAFVPGRTSLGADFFPAGAWIFAHELGHNFSRFHAPCGLSDFDQSYPYNNGIVGQYGYDVRTGTIMSRGLPDLMGYCNPNWVSDYTYEAIYNYRNLADAIRTAESPRQNTLVVWGGVSDGRPVLEPAFESVTVPSAPTGTGPYRIEGFDEHGDRLFAYPFSPQQISHADDPTLRSFAFALPAAEIGMDRLVRIRLTGPGGADEIRLRDAPPGEPEVLEARVDRAGDASVLRWDGDRGSLAVIRDRDTGQIISLARGGEVRLPADLGPVDVDVSLGTRTVRAVVNQP